jgi:hypothetical protein
MRWAPLCIAMALVTSALGAAGRDVLFREDFNSLSEWKPLFFPKIKRHSIYEISGKEGERWLKASSDHSASALVCRKSFSVYEYRRVRWRWRVENVYRPADEEDREGDDYPLRVYVVFRYDPRRADAFTKLRYESAKLLYGEYPPHGSLNYVWASNDHGLPIFASPYTERSKMMALRRGARHAGEWMVEEVDVLADYRRAFGEDPPAEAGVAVMSDSDNTGESSVSFIDFLEIYR